VVNDSVPHDLALSGGEKRLTACAEGQVDHIIGANVVQKHRRVLPADLDGSLMREIEYDGGGTRAIILRFGPPVMNGDLPTCLIIENCSDARGDRAKGSLLSHLSPVGPRLKMQSLFGKHRHGFVGVFNEQAGTVRV
jgi:hypothetical protein